MSSDRYEAKVSEGKKKYKVDQMTFLLTTITLGFIGLFISNLFYMCNSIICNFLSIFFELPLAVIAIGIIYSTLSEMIITFLTGLTERLNDNK